MKEVAKRILNELAAACLYPSLTDLYEARAPARERALGVWDVLFTHCCDSKARQHSPSLQCGPKGSLLRQPKSLRSKVGAV